MCPRVQIKCTHCSKRGGIVGCEKKVIASLARATTEMTKVATVVRVDDTSFCERNDSLPFCRSFRAAEYHTTSPAPWSRAAPSNSVRCVTLTASAHALIFRLYSSRCLIDHRSVLCALIRSLPRLLSETRSASHKALQEAVAAASSFQTSVLPLRRVSECPTDSRHRHEVL